MSNARNLSKFKPSSSGLVETANIADDAITNAKVGENISQNNLLINGDMSVAQRGTSSTSSGIQTVDRFSCDSPSALGITQTQEPTATTDTPYGEGFRNFFRAEVTSASSSTTSYVQFLQQIEAQDVAKSGWDYKSSSSYLTYSFWARSSLAGTYQVLLIIADASPNLYRVQTFTLSANTWTKVSVSFEGNSSLVIDNNNGVGLSAYIIPYYGTGYTGSNANTSSWYALTGSDYLPDFAQNWGDTNGRVFDITGCQLEVGQSATPYKHETFGENLKRCQRYYEEGYVGFGGNFTHSTHYQFHQLTFNTSKRTDDNYSIGLTEENNYSITTFNSTYRRDNSGTGIVVYGSAGYVRYLAVWKCNDEYP